MLITSTVLFPAERLEEAKYVNKSLSALGDALGALVSKTGNVPLNNNKLTETLESTLMGSNCKAAMIVHIAPEDCFRGESLASLMFGQRVSLFKDGQVRCFEIVYYTIYNSPLIYLSAHCQQGNKCLAFVVLCSVT